MSRVWVFCYDIADERRRRHTEKILLGLGNRVQRSVFEVILGESDARALANDLRRDLDQATDSLRAYPLCSSCRQLMTVIGQADPALTQAHDQAFHIF